MKKYAVLNCRVLIVYYTYLCRKARSKCVAGDSRLDDLCRVNCIVA